MQNNRFELTRISGYGSNDFRLKGYKLQVLVVV